MSKAVSKMGEKHGVKAFQVGDKVGFYAPGYQEIVWTFNVVSINANEKIEVIDRDGDRFLFPSFRLDYPSDCSLWSDYQKQLETDNCQNIQLET